MSYPRYRPGIPLGPNNPFDATTENRLRDSVEELEARYFLPPPDDDGGYSTPGGGSDMEPVFVYDDISGCSVTSEGVVFHGADVRYLPRVAEGDGWKADLEAEFGTAKVWSLASIALSDGGCCGDDSGGNVPTGPRIAMPTGPDSINRVKDGQLLDLAGNGAVPGESLTLSVIAINPSTGATSGSAVTPVATNNGDGTWDGASQSLSTLARGICRASITNGSTSHWVLLLNSAHEWEPGESNATGDVYWTGMPDTPDLVVGSDDGSSSSDNITEDTTPTFSVRFSGTEFIGLKDDVAAQVWLVNQSTGAVTIVAGAALDFEDFLTKELTAGTLSLGVYEAYAVLYMTFDNGSYLNEWWSPPSRALRIEIVEDSSLEPPTPRVVRLGWKTTRDGVDYVTIDKCSYPATEEEIAKMDGTEEE